MREYILTVRAAEGGEHAQRLVGELAHAYERFFIKMH